MILSEILLLNAIAMATPSFMTYWTKEQIANEVITSESGSATKSNTALGGKHLTEPALTRASWYFFCFGREGISQI